VSDASPPARRLVTPRWLDARLVLGVLLVLVAVVTGAHVFATAGRYSTVYVARRALVPGERLDESDLQVGRVHFAGGADAYISATGAPPVGYLVTRYVAANELVPIAALSSASAATTVVRLVAVGVAQDHLPGDLGHGDLVDVYVTPKGAAGSSVPPPTRVLSAVPVDSADDGSESVSEGSSVTVVLAVPPSRVADLIHAAESGAIDLVRVPPAAAGSPLPSPAPTP
jgi:hypothetical protein